MHDGNPVIRALPQEDLGGTLGTNALTAKLIETLA